VVVMWVWVGSSVRCFHSALTAHTSQVSEQKKHLLQHPCSPFLPAPTRCPPACSLPLRCALQAAGATANSGLFWEPQRGPAGARLSLNRLAVQMAMHQVCRLAAWVGRRSVCIQRSGRGMMAAAACCGGLWCDVWKLGGHGVGVSCLRVRFLSTFPLFNAAVSNCPACIPAHMSPTAC